MICLRPPRVAKSLSLACISLIALLALAGSLAPGASAAIVHSRTHRVTPALAPLHYTERSFAVPRNAKAGTAHDHTARAHREGQGTAKHQPSAKHGHHQEPDSVAPIPMHRARQNTVSGHGSREIATLSPRRRARIPLPAPDPVVAEVTGRSAGGDYLARLHAKGAPTATPHPQTARTGSHAVVIASNTYPKPAPYAGAPESTSRPQERPPVPIQRRSAPGSSPTDAAQTSAPLFWNGQTSTAIYALPSGNSYAGHSYADDSRSTPQVNPYTTDGIAARQGPAPSMPTAQAPAPDRRYAPIAPAAVVSGFGSEVAIAPAEPTANTRRRNHPIAASALPEDARAAQAPHSWASPPPPATLEEREAITAAAVSPSILPEAYDRDDRLPMPAPLKGSREILIHQNAMAEADGLERIQNDAQLNHLRAIHEIVDLPVSSSLRVNDDLPYNRRAARPWTVLFAQDIARDYYARFHQPLWVTSAVRTAAFQSRLQRVNGNAAGLYGDFASPHLTGQAIDFGKNGMNAAQIAWMRLYLLPLIQSGTIDVEEEFQQACFHLSVYRRYAANRRPAMEYVQVGSSTRLTVPSPPIRVEMPANP